MKKIKITKEGMWLACPIIAGTVMFGSLIYVGFKQDIENQHKAVQLAEYKKDNAKYEKLLAKYKTENTALRTIVEKMSSDIEDLKADKTALELSVNKLKQDRTLYLDGKVYIARQEFTAVASAYTQRDEEGTADGITRTGTRVKEGRTIAVDPNQIPLGSIVYIESNSPLIGGFYIAEDTGGAIGHNRIDVYMDDINKAFKFGKQNIRVTVLEGADLK